MAKQKQINAYLWSVILLGGAVTLAAAVRMPWAALGLRFLLLAFFTVVISSRVSVRIPRANTNVTVSDTFIFLVMLLYGGPAAILVAATEGLASGIRISKTPTMVLFNSGVMACSTSITVVALTLLGIHPNTSISSTAMAVAIMALVQYLSNTTLVGAGLALKLSERFWPTWQKICLWTSITYFGGAAAAGVIFCSFNAVGLYALLITIPIISTIYFTYRKYLEDIRLTSAQAEKSERERAELERERAEQAEHHVEELSRYIAEQERISKALEENKEHFRHAAFHDALTGLPNRPLLIDHLKLAIERSKIHHDHLFAVLFIDLDRFKNINDSLGHNTGDQLLVAIAARIGECLRPTDTIARLGGDEFAILLDGLEDWTIATSVAERVQDELLKPFSLNGHEVYTTASIGIRLSADGRDDAENMLRDADTAMYRAKDNGKARHELFHSTMHTRAVALLKLETDLRRAIEREEFCVHYQPIISLETEALVGFEALARWNHPERGLVSPDEFIPLAEETGLVTEIGAWVLHESCTQLRKWQTALGRESLTMSVNLSGKQLTQTDLIQQIETTLKETGLNPTWLRLEITESVVMENAELATNTLLQLRKLGVHLSIDDFGTGYSSLSYLHRFPVNTLKIDRSFIGRMAKGDENSEIVRTICTLANNLGMEVVAEGVETREQLELLRSLNCEYGQGYLFSKPVDAEKATIQVLENPFGPGYLSVDALLALDPVTPLVN
ncbi:MAG TPA: EAL domain-containing protein [Pyrinomonadaceae bacterium]|jgi:diguanylate cyclase (GGDEF)-like protein|nr:EAL domain-containing protein [Pyrinomonadaceae bacterium]